MIIDGKIWIGSTGEMLSEKVCILPKMANRHGFICGATGTGKTITLKVLAESFSDLGVPVFLADVKGDLAGMLRAGADSEDMQKRIEAFGLAEAGFSYQSYPVTFWDVFGEKGIQLRTTVSEMGPDLLARLMDLNDTQADILSVVFKIADDQGLLLSDTKDLKAMLQFVGENAKELELEYGHIAKQSVGAIVRNVVALEAEGGEQFFAEPALNVADWFVTGTDGKGMINILDSETLINRPKMYGSFMLWMLSELFELLPEIGDPEKPRMVFFFDEAHLLFDSAPKALLEKIEQVVKLIRSKGVGVYFITQSPKDIPAGVLSQCGNKIEHALRAYTPAEQKALKTAAESFRENPDFDTMTVLQELGTGEALISVLDEKGVPGIVQNCKVLPPRSLMGPIDEETRKQNILGSNLYLRYSQETDPDSAYEFFERRKMKLEEEAEAEAEAKAKQKEAEKAAKEAEKEAERAQREAEKAAERAQREAEKAAEKAARAAEKEAEKAAKEEERKRKQVASGLKSVASTAIGSVGRQVGNELGNKLGGRFGKTVGGNIGASLGRNILGTLFKL